MAVMDDWEDESGCARRSGSGLLKPITVSDPLVLTYTALAAAIRKVHGEGFAVFDDMPDVLEFKKKLPAANISYVSGSVEKALMREFIPHKVMKNAGENTFTVITESARFDYIIQISFFADKKGKAQALSKAFYTEIEIENEIAMSCCAWEESMQIFLASPTLPPRGEPDLYQCDQTWRCRGKLFTEEIVNAIDVRNLRFKVCREETRTP